jgi:hypothetical protein
LLAAVPEVRVAAVLAAIEQMFLALHRVVGLLPKQH